MADLRLTRNRLYTCGEYSALGYFNVPFEVTKGKIKVIVYEKRNGGWKERGRLSLNGPGSFPVSFGQQFDGVWKLTLKGIGAENQIGIDSNLGANVSSLVDCIQSPP